MARTMVGDGQEVYRVVVVKRRPRENPEWEQTRSGPYWLYDGEEYESFCGPYNSLATARCQRTREARDYMGVPLPQVVSTRIEKANTTWGTVE